MSSVWLAVIYIGGWILSMRIFGHFWKKRNLKINSAEPWFPKNEAHQQYVNLLQQEEPEATDAQLQTALMRRAIEGVERVLSMREDKPVLAHLVKQGTVGDDIWTEFSVSEKELEQEILDIVAEANTYKNGWGQTILQSASEMVMHEKSKKQEQENKVSQEDEERQQVIEEKRKEQSRVQKEKNKEANKERDRAKALQELLAEEEAEAAKAAKAANAAKKKKATSPKTKRK
ncbi:translocation protein S66 [Entomortierella beljakovae]|nr:translocation protein S66 [Entomortierella beljakovae]